jgi:hypothetical protein
VISKYEVFFNTNNFISMISQRRAVSFIIEPLLDLFQNVDFNPGVIMVKSGIPVDFDSHFPHLLMVIALEHLAKSSSINFIYYLKPILKMIPFYYLIEPSFQVKATIVL